MTPVLVTMAAVLIVAALTLAYAAFPHRGASVPGAAWLGRLVGRAADVVPVVDDGDLDRVAGGPVGGGPDTMFGPAAGEHRASR